MRFDQQQIEAARELQQLGLHWDPRAGHYVFDETGVCQKSSPFQPGVYFILNYEYFMRQVGGVERFKEIMTWLPTWHDAREILASLGVGSGEVAERLRDRHAIEEDCELFVLYEKIAERLRHAREDRGAVG